MTLYFEQQTDAGLFPRARRSRMAAIRNPFDFLAPFVFNPSLLVQAAPRSSFPSVQSSAAGAIPSWDAGPQVGGISSLPNISVPTFLKMAPGTIFQINVTNAGSATGGIYDTALNQPNAATLAEYLVATIPETVGPIVLNWPCQRGIYIVPGAGQIVAAKWV